MPSARASAASARRRSRPSSSAGRGSRTAAAIARSRLGVGRVARPRPPARPARRPGGRPARRSPTGSPAPAGPRGSTPSGVRRPPSGTAGRPRRASRCGAPEPRRRRHPARPATSPACSTSRSAQVAGRRARHPDARRGPPGRAPPRSSSLQPAVPPEQVEPAAHSMQGRRAAGRPRGRRRATRRPGRTCRPAPGSTAGPKSGAVGLLAQAVLERDQAAEQVAAVDRRDVRRRQRLERLGLVPVVEVAPVLLQPVERLERLLQPLDQPPRADVAEVVGREGREQQQPLVGRRGPVGDPAVGDLLEVVGREPVVGVADERLEEVPGLARDPPQGAALGVGQHGARPPAAAADPVGHVGATAARRPGTAAPRPRAGTEHGDQHADRDRQRRRRPHALDEVRQAGPQPLLGRGGRLPLQQLAAAHEQPRRASARSRRPAAGPIGQEDDDPCTTWPTIAGSALARLLQRRRATAPRTHADRDRQHRLEQGQREDRQRHGRPEPGRAGQDRPAQRPGATAARAGPGCGGGCRAASSAPGAAAGCGRRALDADGHPAAEPGEELPVAADPAVLAAGVGVVARREVVEELGVAEQAAAGVVPLDQVVAEDLVLGEGLAGGRLEGVDVVDPLAGEACRRRRGPCRCRRPPSSTGRCRPRSPGARRTATGWPPSGGS